MNIAVLMTCYNRREKTLACLDALQKTSASSGDIQLSIYLTDDGCSDGTADAVRAGNYAFPVHILQGDGNLFWNGGMILAWKAALADGGYDGYLWMNDDTTVLPEIWQDLLDADAYCVEHYGKRGIYAGSTKDKKTGAFTYGGFDYYNKILLLDRFVIPDGKSFQPCEVAHGNATYVSQEVVDKMGTAVCENDHIGKIRNHTKLPLKERMKLFNSPRGYNMHNILLFNKHCFPWRVPFVYIAGVSKMLFPKLGYGTYLFFRKLFK